MLDALRAGKDYKTAAFELGICEGTARVLGSRALRKRGLSRLQFLTARTQTHT